MSTAVEFNALLQHLSSEYKSQAMSFLDAELERLPAGRRERVRFDKKRVGLFIQERLGRLKEGLWVMVHEVFQDENDEDNSQEDEDSSSQHEEEEEEEEEEDEDEDEDEDEEEDEEDEDEDDEDDEDDKEDDKEDDEEDDEEDDGGSSQEWDEYADAQDVSFQDSPHVEKAFQDSPHKEDKDASYMEMLEDDMEALTGLRFATGSLEDPEEEEKYEMAEPSLKGLVKELRDPVCFATLRSVLGDEAFRDLLARAAAADAAEQAPNPAAAAEHAPNPAAAAEDAPNAAEHAPNPAAAAEHAPNAAEQAPNPAAAAEHAPDPAVEVAEQAPNPAAAAEHAPDPAVEVAEQAPNPAAAAEHAPDPAVEVAEQAPNPAVEVDAAEAASNWEIIDMLDLA